MTVVEQARAELTAWTRSLSTRSSSSKKRSSPTLATACGVRTVQNWIGGSSYHPLGADFVPPRPPTTQYLARRPRDLHGGACSPIVQAALVHARSRPIPLRGWQWPCRSSPHPHTVLMRQRAHHACDPPDQSGPLDTAPGLCEGARRLPLYRRTEWRMNSAATHRWIAFFAQAIIIATEQVERTKRELDAIRTDWDEQLALWRTETGHQRALRSTSATARILDTLDTDLHNRMPVGSARRRRAGRNQGDSCGGGKSLSADIQKKTRRSTSRRGSSTSSICRCGDSRAHASTRG